MVDRVYAEEIYALVKDYQDFVRDLKRWIRKGYIIGFVVSVKPSNKRPEYLEVCGWLIAKDESSIKKLFDDFHHFYP